MTSWNASASSAVYEPSFKRIRNQYMAPDAARASLRNRSQL
jgi:glutamine synthetase